MWKWECAEAECLIVTWPTNLLFSTVSSAGIYLTFTTLLSLSFSPPSLSRTLTQTHTHASDLPNLFCTQGWRNHSFNNPIPYSWTELLQTILENSMSGTGNLRDDVITLAYFLSPGWHRHRHARAFKYRQVCVWMPALFKMNVHVRSTPMIIII